LQIEEMPYIVRQYARGSRNALEAGFDGVEVHAANGYLLDQFINSSTNRRADAYGGPIENRARLLMEVVDAVSDVWGQDRVGVRLSPLGTFNDMGDDDPETTFGHVAEKLNGRALAYLHIVNPAVAAIDHRRRFRLRHFGGLAPAREGGSDLLSGASFWPIQTCRSGFARAPPLTPTIRPPTMAAAPKGIPTIPPLPRNGARNRTPALTKGGDNADVLPDPQKLAHRNCFLP
jgi:hypothetical protein